MTQLSERDGRRTLLVAGLAVFVTFLDTTVLFVAFPDISRTFSSAGPGALSWVLNAYTITFAALLVPAGKLADRLGHRRLFLLGSALFTTASVACAVAPTVEVLIAFRSVQALGAAALVPSSLALVLRAFPRDRLPVAVAIWGAMGAAAGTVGPTLGAVLVEAASWRWVFMINLPAGLLTLGLGRRMLRESSDPSTRVPALLGVVTVAGAAAFASLAVVQSDDWGWIDGRTAGALAAAVVTFAVFVAHQRRTTAPAIELSLFSIRNYAWGNLATFAFGIAFTAMFFGSFLVLTELWGWSVLRAGLGISPGPLLVLVLAPRVGRLAARIGQGPLLMAGGLTFAASGLWRLIAIDAHPNYLGAYLPAMLLSALGVVLCFPQLASVTAQALPPNLFGVGGAANQAVRQFGGTLGVALTIALVSRVASTDLVGRFDRVWALVAVGGVVTTLLCTQLRTSRAVVEPIVRTELAAAA
jgi:EmrB/QacA subfamily drug resistance transporter